jgi:hypothetical protein
MIYKIFILLFSVFTIAANAQSKKQVREYNIRGAIETKVSYTNGVESERYVREKFAWDKKGKLILEERFQANGDLLYRETAVYKGDLAIVETQEYPKSKRVIDKSEYLRTVNTYSGEDKIQEEDFDRNNKLIAKRVNTFNRFGDKIEEIEYSAEGAIISKTTYQYDKRGLKTEKLSTDEAGVPQVKIIYEYTY